MKPLRLAYSLASVAVLAAGCTAPTPTPQHPVIGLIAPVTGPDAGAGVEAVRGAELAVDVVNKPYPALPVPLGPDEGLPGLGGAVLALSTGDTATGVDAASAQVTTLIEERHAVGLVTAGTADLAAAAASQAQRLRTPIIDVRSTADYLTELGMDWYFRSGPSDSQLAGAAFALLEDKRGATPARIGLVTEAGGDSATALARIRSLALQAGAAIAIQQELSAPDSTEPLTSRLRSPRPHAVFAWAHTAAGARAIVRAVSDMESPPPVVGLGEGFRHLGQPAGAPALVLRAVAWSAEFSQRSPAAKAVAQLYAERFGQPMTAAAAQSFTAVIALAVAIDTAGSADAAAIRTALRQTSLPAIGMIMPWNGLRFSADGHNPLAAGVVEEWQDPAFRLVFPVELASGPSRWTRLESDR
jgi:branched-chain amino acid transport system substrate-binding protein